MEVKPLAKIAEKFVRRASAAGGDFKEGVETTRKDQAENAIAATESYEVGVTEAIARGAFAEGLRESGHAKWKLKAAGKGAIRYPQGVREAGPDFQKGYAPMHSALEGLTLGPRGPRGSPQNYERSRVVGVTLHKVRIGE